MKRYKYILQYLLLSLLFVSCAKELIYDKSNEENLETYVYDSEKQSLYYSQENGGLLSNFVESHFLKNRLKSLTIIGPINGSDLACIREMAGADIYGNETSGILDSLDLSKSSFEGGGKAYFVERSVDGNYSNEFRLTNGNTIGECSFINCKRLNYVILPNNIVSIERRAFEGCSQLLDINLPNSLKNIGCRAFMHCTLLCPDFVVSQGFVIPEGITEIPDSMLLGCTIMSKIVLPQSIKRIGVSAFNGCRDAEFEWNADNLEYFGAYAFTECKKFEGINIPKTMTIIPQHSFSGCSAMMGISIPESIKSIESYAFNSSGLSGTLILPKTLKHIGVWAFNSTNITSLIVNSDISCDEQSMYWNGSDFGYCKKLKEIVVNEPARFFELRFVHCDSLAKITLPNSLIRFGTNHAELHASSKYGYNFYKCPFLTEIDLPQGLDSIGAASLAYTEIKQVAIPNSVSYIGQYAFENCFSLSDVKIPESVKYIDVAAFMNCTSLLSFVFPNSVTYIGPSALRNCSNLRRITLSNHLRGLEYATFYNCKELEEIEIPHSVEKIAPEAFIGCSKLSKIDFSPNIKFIENNAFSHCSSLKELCLPNSLTLLDYGAFYNCSILESIELPATLDSIGNNAFNGCIKLIHVKNSSYIPQRISASVFKNVPLSLSTLAVPKGTSELYRNCVVWKDFRTIIEQ